jgi:hypothetical protein
VETLSGTVKGIWLSVQSSKGAREERLRLRGKGESYWVIGLLGYWGLIILRFGDVVIGVRGQYPCLVVFGGRVE